MKFNGLLKDITENASNIDIAEFLQEKLHIPDYKAEELARRIKSEYCTNIAKENSRRTILEAPEKSELCPNASAYPLDSLSEKEFEHVIGWLLSELGYEVQQEKRIIKLGFDLVASKDDQKVVILCRRYPISSQLSDSIVLISEEAMQLYMCKRSIFIATTRFSQKTMQDAEMSNIELWDYSALTKKIADARKNSDHEEQFRFPQYKQSLFQTLLRLDETKNFIIEPRTDGKYDIYLSGVKFPLLTFRVHSDSVTQCIYRIKNSQPVRENEGLMLIDCEGNNGHSPDDVHAYDLIVQYLEEFLK